MAIDIDFSQIAGFAETMELAPELFASELVSAFQNAGKTINEQIRAAAAQGLKLKTKGTAKVWKYKAADKNKIGGNVNKVFVDFYTKWKAASIFETGGTIHPAIASALMVLTDLGRGPSGKRRWTSQQMVVMIHEGLLRLIKTPNGWLIVQPKGGLTKTGKLRKGTRDDIVAIIRKSVTEKKRVNFYGTIESNIGFLNDCVETAIENVKIKLEAKNNEGITTFKG
jgi:hypothetical protein